MNIITTIIAIAIPILVVLAIGFIIYRIGHHYGYKQAMKMVAAIKNTEGKTVQGRCYICNTPLSYSEIYINPDDTSYRCKLHQFFE